MTQDKEAKKKKFYALVSKIVLEYPEEWGRPFQDRKFIFEKAVKYIGGAIDLEGFKEDLKKATSIGNFKDESKAVAKILIEWEHKH